MDSMAEIYNILNNKDESSHNKSLVIASSLDYQNKKIDTIVTNQKWIICLNATFTLTTLLSVVL